MKENSIKIRIKKPASEIFEFVLNPENTPKYLDFIVEEKSDGPAGLGIKYTNIDTSGTVTTYELTKFEQDKLFDLHKVGSDYTCQYKMTPISDVETELEYSEWVEGGYSKTRLRPPFLKS